jgi:hypothetical protein
MQARLPANRWPALHLACILSDIARAFADMAEHTLPHAVPTYRIEPKRLASRRRPIVTSQAATISKLIGAT